jgi:hypothetical protein
LVRNEHHGACPGDICGQHIKERPGLVVTAGEVPATRVQSLGSPRANGCARLEADNGDGLVGDKDLEYTVLNEQLGKAFGILAIVCIRIPRDNLLDSQLIFVAHRGPLLSEWFLQLFSHLTDKHQRRGSPRPLHAVVRQWYASARPQTE